MPMQPRYRFFLLIALVLFGFGGCSTPRSGGYYSDDGPPARTPNELAAIPDAVPRAERPSASGNKPYTALNKTYYPLASAQGYRERGVASWYGKKFHGRRTSSGEAYDMYAMSAAHKTLPIPCYARVRNLRNGRETIVRVNDRGPFLHNRLIDLSYAAATRLGIVASGTGLVEVEVIDSQAPATAMATSAHAPASEPRIYVQAGAFAQAENAERLRARLQGAGFTALQIAPNAAGVHRVRIGPLANVEASDRTIAALVQQQIDYAHVVIDD